MKSFGEPDWAEGAAEQFRDAYRTYGKAFSENTEKVLDSASSDRHAPETVYHFTDCDGNVCSRCRPRTFRTSKR
jgi:hypothetical protein